MAVKLLAFATAVVVSGNRVPDKQEMALVQSVASMVRVKTLSEQDDDHIDHVDGHIVCYSQDCSEARATLEVYAGRAVETQRRLDECAANREQLQTELAGAAEERSAVVAALEQCGRDREDLQSQLEECGLGRASLEQALAKCASERAVLEEELRQCAEVDRPAAEEALAKCAEERAALEAQLEELARRLEEQEDGGSSSRRRRRRRPSLLQEGSSAEVTMLQMKLKETKEREQNLGQALQSVIERTELATAAMENTDKEIEGNLKKLAKLEEEDGPLRERVAEVEAQFAKAAKQLQDSDGAFTKLLKAAENATKQEGQAAQDLATDIKVASTAALSLLNTVHSKVEKREHALKKKYNDAQQHLDGLKVLLASKEEHGREEECADLRVEVIQAKGNLELFASSLEECLESKKIISARIEAANRARQQAQQGLDECLAAKTRLQAALNECHDRCEQTSILLDECLARKDELRGLIDECHSRRDEARASLQECLAQKEQLQERIEELRRRLGDALLSVSKKTKRDAEESDSDLIRGVITMVEEFSENVQGYMAAEERESREVLKVLRQNGRQSQDMLQASTDMQQATEAVRTCQKASADGIGNLHKAAELMNEAATDDAAAAAASKEAAQTARTAQAADAGR